jgi:Predicted endonuclease containing a URI domain
MREHQYYVYILTNRRGTLYTGVTNNLERRLAEHRAGRCGFTSRYRIGKLIYFETTDEVWATIGREKQIKGWLREKKFALILTLNPRLRDLSYDFAPPPRRATARAQAESQDSVEG